MAAEHHDAPAFTAFCTRHFRSLAVAVLALAAFNLTYRLGSELITDWDESLYAISASEIVKSGDWIGVTYFGELDYYNPKPPLNVWLITLAFKTFGANLWSLRLVSSASAWLTVLVLMLWARRTLGAAVGLAAGVVLITSFAFMYVHSARSANTDALFTLLVLLTVVALWAADQQAWHYVWLGPILAAVVMLRGMAVLMPLALVVVTEALRVRRRAADRLPLAVSSALFVTPVLAWTVARWRLDGARFFQALFGSDFIARSTRPIEGHEGGAFYYVDILLKHQYDWLVAAAVVCLLFPLPRHHIRTVFRRDSGIRNVVLVGWVGATVIIPTLMRTKLPWYLNAFYPAFALGTGWILVQGICAAAEGAHVRRRRVLLFTIIAAMFGIAEGKLLWYSFHQRDLHRSAQGLLLSERHRLEGRRVFCSRFNRGEAFVIDALVHSDRQLTESVEGFMAESRSGDYWLSSANVVHPDLVLVRSHGSRWLFQRR